MDLNYTLKLIRSIARNEGPVVLRKLFHIHFRSNSTEYSDFCLLCGSESNITREHVLPRWVFENNPNHFFVTDVNQLPHKYIEATVPMCRFCNNEILNKIETYVQKTISKVDLEKVYYSPEEWENIIRWLEIIDFKFQLLDVLKKFKAHKTKGFFPGFSEISIAEMRYIFSIRKIQSNLRSSLKRISQKNKSNRAASLIVGKTKIKTFNYFHTSGDFIHLEIPKYNKAFFYFFERSYKSDVGAKRAATRIIKSVYSSD